MRTLSSWLLCLVPLLAAAPVHAQAAEPAPPWRASAGASSGPIPDYAGSHGWFTRDKLYHFGVSAAGSGALYAAGRRVGLGRREALAAAALVVGAAGVWREVGTSDPDDLLTRQRASRRDLVWDGVGIAVGLVVADRWLGARAEGGEAPPAPPPPPADAAGERP
ncbi:MAG TPA: hypothetical protein VHG51_03515 [Longimicrobiaceae bacterium]|nr:hypothetical protein [Longimicrobiaceae bacterium]